jgi:hypothetical protein
VHALLIFDHVIEPRFDRGDELGRESDSAVVVNDGVINVVDWEVVTRPGVSGDRIPWKDLSYGTSQ